MKLPSNFWPDFSYRQKIIFILAILCFIGLIVLGALALAVRSRLQAIASIAPTQVCRPSTLVLGQTTFEIQILPLGSDGLSNLPTETAGIAYWVSGSQMNPVFVLSPTSDNLAVVSTINLGSEATATWSDCTILRYPVTAHEPGIFNASDQPDRLPEGITIFFPIDAAGAGFLFTAHGSADQASVVIPSAAPAENTQPTPVENTVSPPLDAFPTPEGSPIPSPDYSQIQAEIGVLDVITSPDEKTITLNVSIYNYGTSAFTLSPSDVSLTEPGGTSMKIIRGEPSLPMKIAATATETFAFTFPRPSSPTATLRILTIEYDIEGY